MHILKTKKSIRIKEAVDVSLTASDQVDYLSIVQCASGQDRTGTVMEKMIQTWIKEQYKKLGLKYSSEVRNTRALGGAAAEITAHLAVGSPGMKEDSIAGSTFNEKVTATLYRKSANTNKENPVANVDFLKIPSAEAINQYKADRKTFKLKLNDAMFNNTQLRERGLDILRETKKLEPESDAETYALSSAVFKFSTKALDEPKDAANSKKLSGLSKIVSGKSGLVWKALGWALLAFTAMTLVVGLTLLFIHTGGIPFLAAALGLAAVKAVGALSITTVLGLGIGAVAGTSLLTSAGFFGIGCKRGLAKSVAAFKTELDNVTVSANKGVSVENEEENTEDFSFSNSQ